MVAKSARTSSPANGTGNNTHSSGGNNKKATAHHQLRRPPSNSSGNISILERAKPLTTENDSLNSERSSLESVELEKEELETIAAPSSATPTARINTQVMKLNAVPLKMLSPVLSKDAFQQKQQQGQQREQPQPDLSLPGSDGLQILELIVGRVAFCGLFGTLFVSICTGQTLPQQIGAYPDNIFLMSIAMLLASFAVVKRRTSIEEGNNKDIRLQFVPALSSIDVEKWIGRVAMLGFGGLLAWQLLSSS